MFKKPIVKIRHRQRFEDEKMEIDEEPTTKHSSSRDRDKKKDKKEKDRSSSKSSSQQKSSLLSFADHEEEDCEVFKVKKSKHSKMLDKERRKKKNQNSNSSSSSSLAQTKDSNNFSPHNLNSKNPIDSNSVNNKPDNSTETNNSNLIQKEIRTAGLLLVVKNSDPEVILNGRAALCAGKDDMSSEEEDGFEEKKAGNHKFAQPDNLNFMLENGKIPDASMIHEARKRRQKARELGDYVTIEEPPEDKKGKRIVHEDEGGDGSDEEEERVDMLVKTLQKEREERREKFYSVQQEYSGEDSDLETNEWENQQIRKGVTGAQLMSAQQESMFSQYMIQPFSNSFSNMSVKNEKNLTTAELLEQAYSHINYEVNNKKVKKQKKTKKDGVSAGPKTPAEIMKLLTDKLEASKELNRKHFNDIERITNDVENIKLDLIDCERNAPETAAKYKFYQEIKCYVSDLVECFNEKIGPITNLEERAINLMGRYSQKLIERRHQDMRDQAAEVIESKKRVTDDEEKVRRAAEREGRRTRRRRDREKNGLSESHYEGMSSDDEIPDIELSQYRSQIAQIKSESLLIFEDVSEEYSELPDVLKTFEEWKLREFNSYKEAYVHLCLPKISGTLIRPRLVLWNPFDENYEDIEKMQWFHLLAMYGRKKNETEEDLRSDPDLFLVPIVIEKIILPKLTRIIQEVWDPLSTTQTLKLVGLLRKLQNDYPSVKQSSKKLHVLFDALVTRMTTSTNSDVFIPILQKQPQDSKNPFFQRQFYSGLKLFRNILSFQGIVTDSALKELAISSILNKYLLLALRIVNPCDGIAKAHMIVYTLPRIWFSIPSIMESLEMFKNYIKSVESQLDKKNTAHLDSFEKLKQIMSKLQPTLK